ncbi:hypothetical protein [Nocardioides scoriae]|uniref:hypothetical protein n=1 Tax=Nocardioides scoriae TaxID=642780 RepID=UPI000B82D181
MRTFLDREVKPGWDKYVEAKQSRRETWQAFGQQGLSAWRPRAVRRFRGRRRALQRGALVVGIAGSFMLWRAVQLTRSAYNGRPGGSL